MTDVADKSTSKAFYRFCRLTVKIAPRSFKLLSGLRRLLHNLESGHRKRRKTLRIGAGTAAASGLDGWMEDIALLTSSSANIPAMPGEHEDLSGLRRSGVFLCRRVCLTDGTSQRLRLQDSSKGTPEQHKRRQRYMTSALSEGQTSFMPRSAATVTRTIMGLNSKARCSGRPTPMLN